MRHPSIPGKKNLICLALVTVILLLSRHAYPSAATCAKDSFIVEINIGHDKNHTGATSACGIPEYEFNVAAAQTIARELSMRGFSVSLTTGIAKNTKATGSPKQTSPPSLLISLHHDSVQPQYLSTWTCNGKAHLYSDEFSGFSIFYSAKYGRPQDSLYYATILGTQLLREGLTPTLHHAAQIPGENRQLVDSTRGIYVFDALNVLRHSRSPAILLECGIIVNRKDEQAILTEAYRRRIAKAIADSAEQYCEYKNRRKHTIKKVSRPQ